jgi:hypothetical protein
MKNKLVVAALAALLVCGLAFTACENGVQDVKIAYDKANAVAGVTAVLTTGATASGDRAVIVSWDAAEDANGYRLFVREGDKKTVQQINSGGGSGNYPQNYVVYALADGSTTSNTDPDKWSALVSISGSASTGKSYTFGIQTSPLTQGSVTYSDIVWSNAITAP